MNPIRTLVLTLALLAAGAAAQTLYFYPPDDAKWIAGRAYISQGDATSAKALTIDSTKCGWYKVTLSANDPLRNYAQFWLGKPGKDRIGPNGRLSIDYESVDDFDANAGVFRLGEKLNGHDAYLVADELDAADPNSGWYTTDPGYNDESRCRFELAAFIYDTDISVHPDFSCGEYSMGQSAGNGPDTKPNCTLGTWTGEGYSATVSSVDAYTKGGNLKGTCTGVRPGVVQKELGDDRKIKYNKSGDLWNCWTDESWFNKAFTSTPGVNVEHCYDMPFTQVKSGASAGSFEFDSDKLRNGNGYIVGGFFPELLHNAPADATCPNCNAKRPAECFAPLIKQISTQVFDNYTPKTGEFDNGNNPVRGTVLPGVSGTATDGVWNWANPNEAPDGTEAGTRQGMKWYMHGTTPISGKNMAAANLFFCFESHAEFYYDPSQVFYFRGDDDIWIYINKKLAIDLGGTHLAAPGKIDLGAKAGELGLVEGELYPIDIFFCDRRSTMSNVRISTNMYIAQKSSFYSDPKAKENHMCAFVQDGSNCASKMGLGESTGGGTLCANELTSGGFTVDFYMIPRGNSKDTLWLSGIKDTKNCNGDSKNFTCYGASGIRVKDGAVYSCGEKTQCRGDKNAADKVNISGNFNIYARLMGSDGKQVPGSKPLLIDQLKGEAKTSIVWGNLTGLNNKANTANLKDAYNETTKHHQTIIAGKRTPIYIASGSWDDESYTSFSYDDPYDSFPSDAAGFGYSVSVTGATGLTIYKNKTGDETKSIGTLPRDGIDTLWVESDFKGGDKTFYLNVVTESAEAPSLRLDVYQPKLKFVDEKFQTQLNPNGYTNWQNDIPYIGTPLEMYIVALDTVKNEICGHCNFTLLQESKSVNNPNVIGTVVVAESNTIKIVDGKLSDYISGLQDTGPNADQTAYWKVSVMGSPEISAQWNGLRFKEAPVPYPNKNYVYDRNGDGIGDSLRLEYNKSLISKGDSLLPVLLEIVWEEGDTAYFHHNDYTVSQLKDIEFVKGLYSDPNFFTKNRAYWNQFLRDTSTIEIRGEDRKDGKTTFSKDILTYGSGKTASRTPFIDPDKCSSTNCAPQYTPMGNPLKDGISPIVLSAEYKRITEGDCESNANGCRDRVIVTLSEPVFAAGETASPFDYSNPFDYCLGRSQGTASCPPESIDPNKMHEIGWDNLDWDWERPANDGSVEASNTASYNPGNKTNSMNPVGGEGHTNVEVIYIRHKYSDQTTDHTPLPGDWVKLRQRGVSVDVFADAEGNLANLKERGVMITGEKPADTKQIKIGEITAVNPNDPSLNGIFEDKDKLPPWFDPDILDDIKKGGSNELFKGGNVVEFLPVPGTMTSVDSVKKYFPGSLGTLFVVDVPAVREDIRKSCSGDTTCYVEDVNGNRVQLTESNISNAITIHASAFYHTNLGDYTAHRDPIFARCTDKIFKGDCAKNEYNFYLAWDLKTNAGRFVGSGAYVAISKFYWKLDYIRVFDGKEQKVSKTKNKKEFIEMFGVKRAKPSKPKQQEPPPEESAKVLGAKKAASRK